MKFSLLAIAALSTTTAAFPRKRKVAKKGEGSANSSGTCDPNCGGTKTEGQPCYGGADSQNRGGLCVDGLYCYNYPTTIVSDTSGGAFCCPEGLAPTNQNSCGHLPPPGPGPTPSPVPAPSPGPPSPFKPATWTINAWGTNTDNAAGLCYGICKKAFPPGVNPGMIRGAPTTCNASGFRGPTLIPIPQAPNFQFPRYPSLGPLATPSSRFPIMCNTTIYWF